MTSRRFVRTIHERGSDFDEEDDYIETTVVEDEKPFFKRPIGIAIIVGGALLFTIGITSFVAYMVRQKQEKDKKEIDRIRREIDEERLKNRELEDKLLDKNNCKIEGMVQISEEEYESLEELRRQVARYLEERKDNQDYNEPPLSDDDSDRLDIPMDPRNRRGDTYFRTQLVYSRSLDKLKLCKIESKVIDGQLIDIDRECVGLDTISQPAAPNSPASTMNNFVRQELARAMGRNRRMDARIAQELSQMVVN